MRVCEHLIGFLRDCFADLGNPELSGLGKAVGCGSRRGSRVSRVRGDARGGAGSVLATVAGVPDDEAQWEGGHLPLRSCAPTSRSQSLAGPLRPVRRCVTGAPRRSIAPAWDTPTQRAPVRGAARSSDPEQGSAVGVRRARGVSAFEYAACLPKGARCLRGFVRCSTAGLGVGRDRARSLARRPDSRLEPARRLDGGCSHPRCASNSALAVRADTRETGRWIH